MNGDVKYVGCQTFGGGFDIGATLAGLQLTHRLELPGGYGLPACEANKALLGDFKSEVGPWQEWDGGSPDVVLSNPPCSGFSLMSANEFRGVDSRINDCMWAYAEYVGRKKPHVAVMESVQQAYTGGRLLMQQLRARVEEISGLRYDIHHVMHDGAILGSCAIRKRYFFVLSRGPFNVAWDPATPRRVLRDAIGDLEDVPCGLSGSPDGHDWVRNSLTRRIIAIMPNVEWNEGEYLAYVLTREYDRTGTFPGFWGEDHMRNKLLTSARHGTHNVFGGIGFHQPTRWIMDGHGRVVTGGTPTLGYHPTLHRPLTLREMARVLGYPDSFTLRAHWEANGVGPRWLGKGVCVESGRWIADLAYLAVLCEDPPGDPVVGETVGDREILYRADRLRRHEYAGKAARQQGMGVK